MILSSSHSSASSGNLEARSFIPCFSAASGFTYFASMPCSPMVYGSFPFMPVFASPPDFLPRSGKQPVRPILLVLLPVPLRRYFRIERGKVIYSTYQFISHVCQPGFPAHSEAVLSNPVFLRQPLYALKSRRKSAINQCSIVSGLTEIFSGTGICFSRKSSFARFGYR